MWRFLIFLNKSGWIFISILPENQHKILKVSSSAERILFEAWAKEVQKEVKKEAREEAITEARKKVWLDKILKLTKKKWNKRTSQITK